MECKQTKRMTRQTNGFSKVMFWNQSSEKLCKRTHTCPCSSLVLLLITSSFGSKSICSLEAANRFSAITLLDATNFSDTLSFCCNESAKRSKYLKQPIVNWNFFFLAKPKALVFSVSLLTESKSYDG